MTLPCSNEEECYVSAHKYLCNILDSGRNFSSDHTLGTYYDSQGGQYFLLWLKGTITNLEKVTKHKIVSSL